MSKAFACRVSGLFLLATLFACASDKGFEGPGAQPNAVVQAQPGDPAWPTSAPLSNPTLTVDAEHYSLELDLLVPTKEIHGRLEFEFVARTSTPLEEVRMDCAELVVQSVHDRARTRLPFKQEGETLLIELAEPLDFGSNGTLFIEYQGKPRKGLYYVAGEPTTQVFTQGECEGSRYWLPCIDRPDDRATSDLTVSMPSNWVSMAAGDRIESKVLGNQRIESWRMVTPHPVYLMTLVAGVFDRQMVMANQVPLELMLPEQWKSFGPSLSHVTGQVLAFMEDFTGYPYPYSKYGTSWVEDFPFGGMENISATTLTDRSLGGVRGMRDKNPYSLIAHEAAHQWFGDLLTCETWSEIWLNEGFATFSAAEFMRELEGEEAHLAGWRDMRLKFLEKDTGDNARPLVHATCIDPFDLFFSGHAYQGGALFLAYLRSHLGEDVFTRGVREYVGAHHGRSVNTEDLLKTMERVSGVYLKNFFEQWANQSGHPSFESDWKYDQERGRILLSLNQVHERERGMPTAFSGSLMVEVRTDESSEIHRVVFGKRREIIEIPCAALPIWVRADPEGVFPADLTEKRGEREWHTLAEAGIAEGDKERLPIDITARLAALDHFLKDNQNIGEGLRASRLQLVRRLAQDDPDPVVQVRAIHALLELAGEAAREALRHLARSSSQTQVRVAALQSLAKLDPVEITAGFAKSTYEVGYSWETMGAALALWFRADPQPAWRAIQAAAKMPEASGPFAPTLVRATREVDMEQRVPWLLSVGGEDQGGSRLRGEALRALGPYSDREDVRQILIASLESPYLGVKAAAIQGLCVKVSPEIRSALVEHYRTCLDARHKRMIEKAVNHAAAGGAEGPTGNAGTADKAEESSASKETTPQG